MVWHKRAISQGVHLKDLLDKEAKLFKDGLKEAIYVKGLVSVFFKDFL